MLLPVQLTVSRSTAHTRRQGSQDRLLCHAKQQRLEPAGPPTLPCGDPAHALHSHLSSIQHAHEFIRRIGLVGGGALKSCQPSCSWLMLCAGSRDHVQGGEVGRVVQPRPGFRWRCSDAKGGAAAGGLEEERCGGVRIKKQAGKKGQKPRTVIRDGVAPASGQAAQGRWVDASATYVWLGQKVGAELGALALVAESENTKVDRREKRGCSRVAKEPQARHQRSSTGVWGLRSHSPP